MNLTNDEHKFELTWVQGEHRLEPLLRFEAFDPAVGKCVDYEADFDVCVTPRCPCCSVYVYCRPISASQDAAPVDLIHEFWLDLWKKSVETTPELKPTLEALRLGEIIRISLADSA